MSTRDIISKLTKELDAGITTEVQVVYVLAGVRKLIERDGLEDQYKDLRFHVTGCSIPEWTARPRRPYSVSLTLPIRSCAEALGCTNYQLRFGVRSIESPR